MKMESGFQVQIVIFLISREDLRRVNSNKGNTKLPVISFKMFKSIRC